MPGKVERRVACVGENDRWARAKPQDQRCGTGAVPLRVLTPTLLGQWDQLGDALAQHIDRTSFGFHRNSKLDARSGVRVTARRHDERNCAVLVRSVPSLTFTRCENGEVVCDVENYEPGASAATNPPIGA